jgi:hypothetical protein
MSVMRDRAETPIREGSPALAVRRPFAKKAKVSRKLRLARNAVRLRARR